MEATKTYSNLTGLKRRAGTLLKNVEEIFHIFRNSQGIEAQVLHEERCPLTYENGQMLRNISEIFHNTFRPIPYNFSFFNSVELSTYLG